jgi:cardiolipin synthase
MPSWFTLANFFTLVRLVLVPFIVQAILSDRPVLAVTLFCIAAFTDILDGAAARGLHRVTQTGAYFDPIADKALLSGVFLALAGAGTIPIWLLGVVLGRDLYILAAAGVLILSTRIRKFPPSVWGKLSTFVQICSVVVWMSANLFKISLLDSLSSAMIWICAAFTIWSGLHYTWRGIQLARAD